MSKILNSQKCHGSGCSGSRSAKGGSRSAKGLDVSGVQVCQGSKCAMGPGVPNVRGSRCVRGPGVPGV